ncbi:hypothetical protein OS493_026548 [Desmophyllum pertusum]|uniref:Uncharacterized protein n=1 Tax=Desmophyllum pertusum TaxID=174260 RepID=A0A9X0CIM0_9CNID|nr:hypothetical protein OS493_026548 [Desmophyllum pertusum]
MFAFGETVERTPKDIAAERARLKKGKVLGRRRSIEVLQTKESLVLPNIKTTQLTQNCETSCASWKDSREGMNGQECRKPVQQIAKRGRLRDSTFMVEENVNEGSREAESDLEGLFISKLNFHNENRDDSPERFSLGCAKKQRKQRSRLSKTDSGFCEDSSDDVVTHFADSPNGSDKVSNASNSSASVTASPDHTTITSNRASRSEKTRKITVDFKAILNQDKTVVRNTERLNTRASMCVQSQQSLHADLVAFKSLSTHHKGTTSSCTLQTNEHCVKLREVVLKTMRNSYDGEAAVKQSDTSLAVLKTRRRLLGKRNSAGPPFPFTERRVNKEPVVDMSRATCNCRNRRVQFLELERPDSNRQCVSCPVDFRASQPSQERIELLDNKNHPDNGCAVSTSGLTEKALLETSHAQETVDVNVKCQEWLNRWLAFNSAPQNVKNSEAAYVNETSIPFSL